MQKNSIISFSKNPHFLQAHVVSAFEHSLANMTSRLEQLNQTSERKVFLNHFPWKNAIKKENDFNYN